MKCISKKFKRKYGEKIFKCQIFRWYSYLEIPKTGTRSEPALLPPEPDRNRQFASATRYTSIVKSIHNQ